MQITKLNLIGKLCFIIETKPQDILQECDKTDLFLMSADERFPMRAKQLLTETTVIR